MKNQQKTHWLSSPNKNYLGHWDLPEEGDLILTIKSAQFEEVVNPTLRENHPEYSKLKKVIRFQEEGYKPMIVNQINSKNIYLSTGIRNMEDSAGAKIQLYIGQTKDSFTRETIDCIRVRPKLTEPKAEKQTLSNDRLNDAIKAIKNGKFTVDTFKAKYSLTKEQLKTLDKALADG